MSATVVTPPIAAERVPLGKSSLRRSPGSLMWTWRSTHPGRISASPWSICSSPRRTFLIAAIWPFSSIPMLKGSSWPRKNTRPLMTRTRRLKGPAHDGTAGLGFREDLGLELVDPGRGVEPRVGQEARFHAHLGQEFGRVPGVLDRDLREQESAVGTLSHAQAIHAEGDGLREVFRLLHLDQSRRGQDTHLHGDAVELFRGQPREPRILRGAFRAFLDRLDEREEWLRVANATAQQATRMFVEGDERSGLLCECLGDFNGSFRAFDHVRLEGLARDADGDFAVAVRVRHSPRQQGACLNIVGTILRSRPRTSSPARSLHLGPCDCTRNLYRPRPLIHHGTSCAPASRRRNHDAVPG